jgi:hypothetical protein
MPKSDFMNRDRRKLMELLGETDEALLGVFLAAAQLEKVIFATAIEVTTSDITPPLKKQFNEEDFPTTYQLNWPVKHVYLPPEE